jgi:hypothetical protein
MIVWKYGETVTDVEIVRAPEKDTSITGDHIGNGDGEDERFKCRFRQGN